MEFYDLILEAGSSDGLLPCGMDYSSCRLGLGAVWRKDISNHLFQGHLLR